MEGSDQAVLQLHTLRCMRLTGVVSAFLAAGGFEEMEEFCG